MATQTAPSPEMIPLGLGEVPPAPERRPRVLLIGTSMAAAASIAVFAALLGAYFAVRGEVLSLGDSWLPAGAHIPLSPGNVGMATLGMSCVTAQWAVYAGAHRDRPHAYQAIGITILFGVAHLTQMGYLFTQWSLPLNGESTPQSVLLFTVMGAHVAMVAAALIFFALMGIRSLGGQFTGRDVEGLSAATLYWYVTVGIFAVIWLGILVTK